MTIISKASRSAAERPVRNQRVSRATPTSGDPYLRRPTPRSAAAVAPRRTPRLLVIDDEPAMCELLALYFGAKGVEVTTAHTLDEGLARIEHEQYDLAIVDWRLDGAPCGIDLLELSQQRHPDVPVIIFTGLDDTRSLERQLAGRAAVLHKMGSLNVLSAEVCRHLTE